MEYRFYLYHSETGYKRIKDPKGWDSLGKTVKRFGVDNTIGLKWHGIFFEYSPKLQFIKDGKAFLQYYFERDGVEADVNLLVEMRNTTTRKFDRHYEGKVNFTSYKVNTLFVEVNVQNTGFLEKLKNRMDVKVNLESLVSQGGKAITAFEDETVNIELHSKVIRGTFESTVGGGLFPFQDSETYYLIPKFPSIVSDEVSERFDYPWGYSQTNPKSFSKFIFKALFDGSYDITADVRSGISFAVDEGTRCRVKWWLAYGTSAGGYTNIQVGATRTYEADYSGPEVFYDYDYTGTWTLSKNDEIYLFVEAEYLDNSTLEQASGLTFDGAQLFKVVASTTFPATISKTILIHEAFTRIMQSVTDTPLPFYSEFYGRTDSEPVAYAEDGAGSLRAYTNGNNLRLLDTPIQCSLKDLIDYCFAVDGVGFGVETVNGVQRLRAEPMTHWYRPTRLMRLTNVKDIEKEVVASMHFNQVEAGIDKWRTSTGNINNLDEFVAQKEWNLPITQVKGKLALKSPIINSGYMIEFARRASAEPTKDTDRDNDGYMINLIRTEEGFVPAKDEAFTSITGLISPETSYNLADTPARCLRRHGQLLRAFLEKRKAMTIDFSFGQANNEMASQLITESAPIVERAAIAISSLNDPLFFAETYTFRVKLTKEQYEALSVTDTNTAANVFGFVEFSNSATDFKRGYIIEARPAADSREAVLTLLRANV